jgi:hypothetical protein
MALAPASLDQGCPDLGHCGLGVIQHVPFGDADFGPTQRRVAFRTCNVTDNLLFFAVMVAFVLDADPVLPVGEIGLVVRTTVVAGDGRIQFRFRKAGPRDRQPQERLLRRVGADADERERFLGPPDPALSPMPGDYAPEVGNAAMRCGTVLKGRPRHAHAAVPQGHQFVDCQHFGHVQPGSLRRGHGNTVHHDDLVAVQLHPVHYDMRPVQMCRARGPDDVEHLRGSVPPATGQREQFSRSEVRRGALLIDLDERPHPDAQGEFRRRAFRPDPPAEAVELPVPEPPVRHSGACRLGDGKRPVLQFLGQRARGLHGFIRAEYFERRRSYPQPSSIAPLRPFTGLKTTGGDQPMCQSSL